MTEDQKPTNADDTDAYGDELPRGTELLRGQYRIARFLNAGGFGITYLARDSLDRVVVIKECFPSAMCCRSNDIVRARTKDQQEEFERIVALFGKEARALARLEHPNIVGVHLVFEDNQTAYMALDFVRGRDLLDVVEDEPERLTPELVRSTLLKILDAVAYIHDRDILHRDISPDNILLDPENEPVLIDFGAAREEATRASRVLSQQHTVKDGYSPQEFYISGSIQTPASDLYALGATFYHLISGDPPPVSQTRLAAVAENKPDPYRPLASFAHGYDSSFLSAIDKALQLFPDDRIQSAGAWIDMIESRTAETVEQEPVEQDEDLQDAIRQLVEETNKMVMEAGKTPADDPKKKRKSRAELEPRKTSLFPDLMGPPPPESGSDGIAARPQISPASEEDESHIKETTKRRALKRISKISLWRLGAQDKKATDTAGKVE